MKKLIGLAILLALLAGCETADLDRADKAVADANAIAEGVKEFVEGPAGESLPPAVRQLAELLGISVMAALAVWQRIRASKILEQKNQVTSTLKTIVVAVEKLPAETAVAVKKEVSAEMKIQKIPVTGRRIVRELKATDG